MTGWPSAAAPPYFVTSLLDHPDFTPDTCRHAVRGPRRLDGPGRGDPAARDLGITVFRSYGSTEHPSITGSRYDRPEPSGSTPTATRSPASRSGCEDGEILSRGPDLCLGYTDDALTDKAFDADGWYHTGDIGVLDDDGYLTITDRKSDIIIRGGENISAAGGRGGTAGACPASPRPWWSRRPTPGSANTRRRCCGCTRATPAALDDVRAHLDAVRSGPAEVARGTAEGRRFPAHRQRQGAEIHGETATSTFAPTVRSR